MLVILKSIVQYLKKLYIQSQIFLHFYNSLLQWINLH